MVILELPKFGPIYSLLLQLFNQIVLQLLSEPWHLLERTVRLVNWVELQLLLKVVQEVSPLLLGLFDLVDQSFPYRFFPNRFMGVFIGVIIDP